MAAGKKRRGASRKRVVKEHPSEALALLQEAEEDPRVVELRQAAHAGDVAKVKRLLELGVDPGAEPRDAADTAVLAAVYARKPAVVRVLAKAGADLNDGWPYKPLGLAAGWGHLELLRALIEGGADVNLPDDSGDTPLDEAVCEKRLDVIEELLRAGADPNFVSARNRERGNVHSPLQRAAYNPKLLAVFQKHGAGAGEDFTSELLLGAVRRGNLAEVKRLVNEQGADVNATDADGQFPLLLAAAWGKLPVVKFLVGAGAKVDQSMRWTRRGPAITALDYAKQERQSKVVDYLLGLEKSGKAGRKRSAREAAARRPTGVPTFDVNDTCVLAEAPVEKAAAALARRLGATVHMEDALGRKVRLTKRCFAVFRIVGQPWSIVMRLNCDAVQDYLKPPDGAALSKALKARAIVVTSGDTSGVYQCVTFDKGKAVELLDVGSTAYDTQQKSLAQQLRDWYGIDLSAFRHVDTAGDTVFASSLRKPRLSRIKNALHFIGDYIKAENAFVPFFGEAWGRTGDTVELTIEGLGPDDIERLDYVTVR